MASTTDPKPPSVRLATDGPLAIKDAPLEVGPLDLSAWMPPPPALSTASTPSTSSSTDPLSSMAIEVWRLKGRLARLSEAVPAKEKRPLESAVAKMEEALSAAGVTTEDPEGRPYHDGDPFEVLLFEPTPSLSRPTVLQTVKPAVLVSGKVARRAEVVVGTPGPSTGSGQAAPKPFGGGTP